MQRSICFAAISVIVALAFAAERSSSSEKVGEKPQQITTAELRRATIIGDLGVPLGTIVTVEGKYQDMTFTRAKLDEGRFDLVIDSVNGKALKEPVRFDLDRPRAGQKDGEQFKLVGYEHGIFTGRPHGKEKFRTEGDRTLAGAFPPFGYFEDFSVLKNLAEKPRTK